MKKYNKLSRVVALVVPGAVLLPGWALGLVPLRCTQQAPAARHHPASAEGRSLCQCPWLYFCRLSWSGEAQIWSL